MKKTMFYVLGMAALVLGCNSTDKVTKSSIDQQEVMGKMSLEDKAHFVIGTGMEGFSGDNAVIGATKSLVPGAAGTGHGHPYRLDCIQKPGDPPLVPVCKHHIGCAVYGITLLRKKRLDRLVQTHQRRGNRYPNGLHDSLPLPGALGCG